MQRLRPYKNCDAKYIASWIKTEKMFYQWSAGKYENYPLTAEDINTFYGAQADNDGFCEMNPEETEMIPLMGEEWKCIYLEINHYEDK